MQGGAISVWHDHEGNLKYTLHCYHRLQPAIKSEALGLQAGVVALVPCFPSFLDAPDQPVASSRPVTGVSNMMWVLAVMSGGQLWRWRVPLPVPGQSFEALCSEGAAPPPVGPPTYAAPAAECSCPLSWSAHSVKTRAQCCQRVTNILQGRTQSQCWTLQRRRPQSTP